MDIATILGFVLGFGMIYYACAESSEGNLIMYWDPIAMLIVAGGGIAATLVSFPMAQVVSSMKVAKATFFTPMKQSSEIIATIVSFAEKARREGLLTLEEEAMKLDDPFMKKALRLVVDGTEPELVRDVLEIELAFLEERHKLGRDMFEQLGIYFPSFGMVGTLSGLIAMLANLSDPSSVGVGMAMALTATFYGATLANLVALPMAKKLAIRSSEEVLMRQVIVEGVLAIQNGENPHIVQEKLKAFFPPRMRSNGKEEEEEA
jgi:chemotaxis protein MotA